MAQDDYHVDPVVEDVQVGTKSPVNGHTMPTATRRASSPMMPPFLVSAPGKVIVFGEHAVVYGKVCQLRSQGESIVADTV
jgi:hypothetical protein